MEELPERLKRGPVTFDLKAQLAATEDSTKESDQALARRRQGGGAGRIDDRQGGAQQRRGGEEIVIPAGSVDQQNRAIR